MFSKFSSWRSRTRPLDTYLTEYITQTYSMSAEDAGELQFVKSSQRLAGKNVALFRIYDPRQIADSAAKVTYSVLDDHLALVQFEGRFAPNGNISEIRDKRNQL